MRQTFIWNTRRLSYKVLTLLEIVCRLSVTSCSYIRESRISCFRCLNITPKVYTIGEERLNRLALNGLQLSRKGTLICKLAKNVLLEHIQPTPMNLTEVSMYISLPPSFFPSGSATA